MTYCADKDKATVIYKFNDSEEKRYIAEEEYLPLGVKEEKTRLNTGVKSYSEHYFDGDNPGSYAFTIEAPPEVPPDAEVEIYLESAVWDDYGGIGSYSTGYGIVQGYDGEPILVGTGHLIEGTVTNVLPTECYARISLDWRYKNGCKLVISHEGKVLYEEEGECPLKFEVGCEDECPPGYLKCSSNKYPGYCCIHCKGTANKIRSLGNKL